MNTNKKMLDFIYQNSQMGVNTTEQLIGISEDKEFIKLLNSQHRDYKEINDIASKMTEELGCKEKGIGTFGEITTYMMINIKTLMDKSPSHIAEMMITGSTMGIIQAVKAINRNTDANRQIIDLMKRLLAIEENSFQQLKKFL